MPGFMYEFTKIPSQIQNAVGLQLRLNFSYEPPKRKSFIWTSVSFLERFRTGFIGGMEYGELPSSFFWASVASTFVVLYHGPFEISARPLARSRPCTTQGHTWTEGIRNKCEKHLPFADSSIYFSISFPILRDAAFAHARPFFLHMVAVFAVFQPLW